MSKLILIRTVHQKDLAAISGIEQESFGSNAYPPFFFRQACDVLGNLFLVAENEEGNIIGYTMGSLQSGSPEGWILSVAVKKKHRRRGLGKMLLENLLQKLFHKGAKRVFLTVEPDNKEAIHVYQALDFHEIYRINDYLGPGETRIVMLRKKTSPDTSL